MARKPQQAKPEGTNREKIMSAFMALLAERRIEEISFGDVAASAGLSLAECRAEFGSLMAVLAAQVKEIDRQVLAGGDPDLAGEPPRERLFDVLMRRLEVLAPHKAAIRSLMRSARRNPGLAMALNRMAMRSQQWMLTAADMDAAGLRRPLRRAARRCLRDRLGAGAPAAGPALAPARPRGAPAGRRAGRGVRAAKPVPARSPATRLPGCRRARCHRRASGRCRGQSRDRGRCRRRPGCAHRRAAGTA